MQNRISDQPAFILHRRDYQNTSLILEVFTEDYGRLSVLAKGAKKSRNIAHYQVCTRLSIGWSGRSDLKTLTEITGHFMSISSDCYMAVFYVNELLLFFLPKHDEHRRLFQLYQLLLLGFAHPDYTPRLLEPLLRGFEIDLLTELGLMPELSVEAVNSQAVTPDRYYYLYADAGLKRDFEGDSKSYRGADLLTIRARHFESAEVLAVAKRLLRQIIDYNLQGRTLQSRQFFQQFRGKKKK